VRCLQRCDQNSRGGLRRADGQIFILGCQGDRKAGKRETSELSEWTFILCMYFSIAGRRAIAIAFLTMRYRLGPCQSQKARALHTSDSFGRLNPR
jgi:hypothetical protein